MIVLTLCDINIVNNIMDMLEIDFGRYENAGLLTGRKNGKRAREFFHVKKANYFKFIAKKEQIITSSYFLGLLGEELQLLLLELGSMNELISRLNVEELNEISQDECIRAVRRGLKVS